jgi:4-amino-4-deoxy-L-arabinose transferase-like glycosyltransferase
MTAALDTERIRPAAGQPRRGRVTRLLRGRPADPAWARPSLLVLLVATSALYLAGLSRNGWANDFYSAAVQAGTTSWKASLFGSFDAANFITVDKAPASLWVMELSARIFGLNAWSVLVPQALEGVAAVGALYATVRRWFGPAAGIMAGAVMALTPVATLMFRFNNPDALLVLVMVLAAYATTRAVESGRTRWIALAGALLGLGYLTKMLQAFLVLPAFAVVYLVAGPPRLARRIGQLLIGGIALIVAAGWWVAIVMLTPAADRPYIGGSTTNSILQLTFGYNGFGRLNGHETGSVGPAAGARGGAAFGGPAGLGRLFASEMGGQVSWLIPAALIALAAIAWLSRRARRTDRLRAAALLWGGWLVITGLVFSYMSGIIHPYYTVALAPAIGALTGIGAVSLWRLRSSWPARVAMAAAVIVTATWAWVLLGRSPGWHPGLRAAVAGAGIVTAAVILAWSWVAGRRTGRALPAIGGLAAALAMLGGSAAYSISTAATAHTGALPSAGPAVTSALGGPGGLAGPGAASGGPGGAGGFAPGQPGSGSRARSGLGGAGPAGGTLPSGRAGAGRAGQSRPGAAGAHGGFGAMQGNGPGGLAGDTRVSAALTRLLTAGAAGYRWAAATVGSESAAPLQLASGKPVMAIGGFNGNDPAPTLAAFTRLVAEHKIHYFIGQNQSSFGGGSGSGARITAWVAARFTSKTVGGITVYDLSAGS